MPERVEDRSAGRVHQVRTIPWYFPGLPSMERCRLIEEPDGGRLEGTVVALRGANPVWRVELDSPAEGVWMKNGVPVPGLDGVVDVDLGWYGTYWREVVGEQR